MILFVLAYFGGALTIVSPCILPVLPFLFARADRPFLKSGLPMLIGMALAFAVVATFASVAGGWIVAANQAGRTAALALLAVFGLTLCFPDLSARIMRPFVSLGARMSRSGEWPQHEGVISPMVLGAASGLLWAPCAGPILGLILTGAALQGANARTTVLLLVYAAGAATSIGLALLVGGRVYSAMKSSLGAGEWIRRCAGLMVLAAVVAISLGLDTGLLTNLSVGSTTAFEEKLLDKLHPERKTNAEFAAGSPAEDEVASLRAEDLAPSLEGANEWLNSPPLPLTELKGKVVLVDFWTYSCINCLRSIPYIRAWADKYRDHGLVVIGVHAPEFAFERNVDNVRKAVSTLRLSYPIAIDNGYRIWRAFENQYWPAHYFIDAEGRVRHHHFGEGDYAQSERVIQTLLAEAGNRNIPTGFASVAGAGPEAASDRNGVKSPETYIGYDRGENFVSPGGVVRNRNHAYALGEPELNSWSLTGNWTVGPEQAQSNGPDGGIVYRFHARDLHLVLGPSIEGAAIRFRITIDGKAPGADHGMDSDADGYGVVTAQRLYQLVRGADANRDRTFEIRFLDPGVQAYAFTFG
ncbi:cytochrome c biogenesis protein CcdA/thiol-disulfide isomerase/thioredoxin [Bradyrhizobium sp. AZCC 2262]|uniref:cytochrome c biogenesis protein DipZ n=1 Tax=Bradyrhizobium sp. AZCC 2262 TaxID=3117022 RepID=UPI002FF15718